MAKIYLIEQDPDFAECLRNILESEGYDVMWTPTINEAVTTIADEKPLAWIVDMHDGGLVGPEDIRDLMTASEDNRILVTANYTAPELACKALGEGAEDYLLKPFSTREIIDRIRNLTRTRVETLPPDVKVDRISEAINAISSLDEILQMTLDQLAGTLHMTDCLIALADETGFSVAASRGYTPDPTETSIELTDLMITTLISRPDDPHILASQTVNEITGALGIVSHRPFANLMPLISRQGKKKKSRLIGFIMGHGAFVLEETDLLEMEHFLSRVADEITGLLELEGLPTPRKVFEAEGELSIPETPRDLATAQILGLTAPYLTHENDIFWVRLALDEAINNAIIHGHGEMLGRPKKSVVIHYAVGPTRIKFTVEDTGEGFDHRRIPDPTADENLLSINGRGIFLMRKIMDEVNFNEKGNRVSMVRKIDERPLGPSGAGYINGEFW